MIGASIADLVDHDRDPTGARIRRLYALKPPEYAVYATDTRVVVQFADATAAANRQRAALVGLNPVRGEITGLVENWGRKSRTRARADRYDRRVADALTVALEGDVAGADVLLRAIRQDVLDERVATARFEYLLAALLTGLAGMALIGICDALLDWGRHGVELARAAAAGLIGAFFSTSLGLRGRTVLPDLQRMANLLDANLRMVIGMIAAGTLMAFVASGVILVNVGATRIGGGAGDAAWLLPLIYGFIAGFSERLVPDLLAKANATEPSPPVVIPPAAANAGKAGVGTAAAVGTGAAGEAQPGGGVDAGTDADDHDHDPVPEQAAVDDCACDITLTYDELTDDADLPAAAGGVAPLAEAA